MTDRRYHDSVLEDTVEFAENPEPRCPCVLVLDVSGSMRGARMDTLNQSIQEFKQQVCEDQLTSIRAEIAIIAFSDRPRVAQEFVTVDKFDPQRLGVEGGTKIGIAVVKALDMAEERKRSYRASGINYYRPIIILITDGYPEHDTPQEIEEAKTRVREAEEGRHAAVFSFGVDEKADIDAISAIMTPHRPAKPIRSAQLGKLFEWLSSSLSAISTSQPGQRITLPDTQNYLDF